MAIHFFCTSGAVTAVGPSAGELDKGATVATAAGSGIMQTRLKNVRLLRMVVLKYPTTAAVVTFKDSSGNTLAAATVPLVASIAPEYEFYGIPCPQGGFTVTTTNDADLCFIFDADASIV